MISFAITAVEILWLLFAWCQCQVELCYSDMLGNFWLFPYLWSSFTTQSSSFQGAGVRLRFLFLRIDTTWIGKPMSANLFKNSGLLLAALVGIIVELHSSFLATKLKCLDWFGFSCVHMEIQLILSHSDERGPGTDFQKRSFHVLSSAALLQWPPPRKVIEKKEIKMSWQTTSGSFDKRIIWREMP